MPKLRHLPTLSFLLSPFVSHSSREPTRICAFTQSFVRTTQKRTLNLKGICAFSSAPRSAIINCRLCRKQSGEIFPSSAKRFALAKRLPPSNPFVIRCLYQRKGTPCGVPFLWCGRRDLNPHGVTHRNLKPARLPISPRPHANENHKFAISVFFNFSFSASKSHALPPLVRLPTTSPFSITSAALSSTPKARAQL